MKTIRLITLASLLLAIFALPVGAAAQGINLLPSGEDKVIFGSQFTLYAGEQLLGDLISFGGSVTLEVGSYMQGDLVSFGGNVDAAGEVTGDLIAFGSNIDLSESASIGGDLALVGSSLDRAPGARIAGDVITETNLNINLPSIPSFGGVPGIGDRGRFNTDAFQSFGNPRSLGSDVASSLFSALAFAAVGVLIVLFMPKHTRRTADAALAQPIAAGGLALVGLIALPVLVLLMSITLILIPVAFLLVLLVGFACIFGWVAISLEVGERLVRAMNMEWDAPIQAGVGALVLTFGISLIGLVPCLGWLVSWGGGFLVLLLGLGGVMLSRFGTQEYPVEVALEAEPKAAKTPAKKKAGSKSKSAK
ncbi:MAG: hypothetical protein DWG76_03945 [Chloroflexi bacterium]|nr:hypothetical protein [Chloroflexota bacterium]